MGIIRNTLRTLLDRELGVLGGEVDRLESRHQDLAIALAALQDRYDRLANRVGMRMARAARSAGGDAAAEFAELLRRGGGGPQGNGQDDDDPVFRHMR